MHKERWRKIEEIFERAIALTLEQRRSFVEQICRNDEGLCREILSLLDADAAGENPLDDEVFTLGLEFLGQDDVFPPESKLAFYRIKKLLGRGGMGVVYLAQDTRLNRQVALKILPESLNGNQETISRFRQEARAASNVRHPAVTHVYDFGKIEERYYLAMEYVPGSTLRELIKAGRLELSSALEIADRIASALEAAHSSGILHRDIKPENIIVTDADSLKILDFGLAKINITKNRSSQNTSLETMPGMIMGTSGYMSPEQVRGEETDHSTDIWSLSVILYEMLTGARPFTGKTPSDTRASILRDEPALDNFAPPLRDLFEKSFSKEKEDRFRSVSEFRRMLENLRSGAGDSLMISAETMIDRPDKPPRRAAAVQRFGRWSVLTGAVLLVGLFVLYLFWKPSFSPPQNSNDLYKFARRLTGSGSAYHVAVSPDGETAVYSLETRVGEEGLFIRSLTSGEEKALIAPGSLEFAGVSYSPDGQFIYYAVKPADGIIASLYRLPSSGAGEPQFILEDIDSPPGFSPDGKQFAYLKIDPDGKYEEIALAEADGSNARAFYRREMPDFIPHQAQPVFSSDGERVIFAAGTTEHGVKINEVVAVRVSDRAVEKIARPGFAQISKTVWLKDENAFLMSARKVESEDVRQLWRVSFPAGEATQITDDLLDYSGISVNAAGDKLLTLAGENVADLWLADLEQKSERQITSGGNESKGVAYAADGLIVFSSNSTGRLQIWSANEDGTGRKQLTNDEFSNTEPALSPDGKSIAYVSTRSGSRNIWLMDIDGQSQKRLTSGSLESTPVFTKDGKSVIYFNFNSGVNALSRISLETGESKVLIEGTRRYPAISPDGKWLLSSYREPGGTANKLAVVSLEDPNAAPRVFEPLPGASSPGVLKWLPDGSGFVYIVTKTGAGNLYKQPIGGGDPVKITNFADERIYWFDFSPDGKKVVLSRGRQKRSVILLQKM